MLPGVYTLYPLFHCKKRLFLIWKKINFTLLFYQNKFFQVESMRCPDLLHKRWQANIVTNIKGIIFTPFLSRLFTFLLEGFKTWIWNITCGLSSQNTSFHGKNNGRIIIFGQTLKKKNCTRCPLVVFLTGVANIVAHCFFIFLCINVQEAY